MELPKTKTKADKIDPTSMVLFGQAKCGKTTIVSELENSLLLDLENGSHYVDAVKINIKEEAKTQGKTPLAMLKIYLNKIKDENKKQGHNIYKYLIIDTVSALEEMAEELAIHMYKNSIIGRNWVGTDILSLPQGQGYGILRKALFKIIKEIDELCDTLIILGHVRDKMIEIKGKEMPERGLDLYGKSSAILCASVDAIGYVYRQDEKTIINFKPSEHLVSGSRVKHLREKEITVAKYLDDGTVAVDWSNIFVEK